jgi:hypothetical protein
LAAVSTNIELEPNPDRLRLARNFRRIGIGALVVLLGLGLAGVFDPSEGDVSASARGADGLELRVSYPEQLRGGLESTLDVELSRAGGFGSPIEVAITRDWLELFDLGSIDPQPDSSTGDPDRVIWSFSPPPGDTLEVTVNLTLRPAVRSGEQATVAVIDEGRELASTEFSTGVVP